MASQPSQAKIIQGLLAVAIGAGLIILDLSSEIFLRVTKGYGRWLLYVLPLMLSIWGLKTLIASLAPNSNLGATYTTRLNRNTFHLPMEGYGLLVIMITVFLAAMMGQGRTTNMLLLVFCSLVGPFVVNGFTSFTMLRRIRLTRKLPRRVMAGAPVSVAVTLRNNKTLLPSFLMGVRDRVTGETETLNANVLFSRIPRRSECTTHYQLRLMKRGVYRFDSAEVTTRYPMGFVERGLIVDSKDEIIVYPRIGRLSTGWKRNLSAISPVQQTLRRRHGSMNDDFHHIREYRVGDDPRAIHWKTSARRNELMVQEYRESRERDLHLILDLWSPPKPNDEQKIKVENAVSLAATICLEQIRSSGELTLQLQVSGLEYYDWSTQDSMNMESMLDLMAVVKPGPSLTLWSLLDDINLNRNANTRTVVVSTRQIEENSSEAKMLSQYFQTIEGFQWIDADPANTQYFYEIA